MSSILEVSSFYRPSSILNTIVELSSKIPIFDPFNEEELETKTYSINNQNLFI